MRGVEAIDRIRTFVLEGGRKAAIAGVCVSHGCFVIVLFGSNYHGPAWWLVPNVILAGTVWMAIQAIFATPSYYLLKFVVPSAYQKGLYHFVAGLIVGLVAPLLAWWAYF
ncbi:uncharacterized protein METZ01_LOCUS399759 [marine metagenome]|uniref:Uncharacterized protein n=1 Tax=marine metagenome TaxID=408172 RepID=A0A382VLJ1_9ZZZZ